MTDPAHLVLHGYWRSGTSYRTRIALNIKGLKYSQITYDLRIGQHKDPAFLDLNPQGLVPALQIGDVVLTQSSAIIEWLDECFPEPPLLPSATNDRAIVRAMAMTIACDIHPLNNLRVLQTIAGQFGASELDKQEWLARWITEGFQALEVKIAKYGGRFAFGDTLTMADCCLVPQIYAAERVGVDLMAFPNLTQVGKIAALSAPVLAAHPDRQLDSD